MVRTIDINKYLPVGVSLAGTGRHEINVTLTVEQLKERVYTVEVNDASFTGENDDYIYRAEPDTVNIRIEALAEELDSLTPVSYTHLGPGGSRNGGGPGGLLRGGRSGGQLSCDSLRDGGKMGSGILCENPFKWIFILL